jgi:hypothetical protein
MLDALSKNLRLVIQYVGKEKAALIASEYDMYVLLPLLVHVYTFLNPFTASEIVAVVVSILVDYEVYNFRNGSLYDLMEIDEELVLLMVKEHN